MAKNTGRQKNILAANGVRRHAPRGGSRIFFFGGGGRGGESEDVGFFLFPMCSHDVLNVLS